MAVGLPAIVAGPAEGDPVDDDWPAGSPPMADDPLADTVERFLAALLTGNGELGRYAAPGSDLRAAAATFETVTLDRVAVRGAAATSAVPGPGSSACRAPPRCSWSTTST